MSVTYSATRPATRRWHAIRGLLAATAATLLIGAAVIAPFSVPTASADQQFYERIHQQFVPVVTDQAAAGLDIELMPLEKIPDPEPEKPVVAPLAVQAPERPAAPLMYTGGGSPAEWMSAAGIPESEWGYVDAIISRESGWNPNATNSSSGACGLAQALPCSKVPGSGYDPVANLSWANGYAHGRYGGWAQAYNFWMANHWW